MPGDLTYKTLTHRRPGRGPRWRSPSGEKGNATRNRATRLLSFCCEPKLVVVFCVAARLAALFASARKHNWRHHRHANPAILTICHLTPAEALNADAATGSARTKHHLSQRSAPSLPGPYTALHAPPPHLLSTFISPTPFSPFSQFHFFAFYSTFFFFFFSFTFFQFSSTLFSIQVLLNAIKKRPKLSKITNPTFYCISRFYCLCLLKVMFFFTVLECVFVPPTMAIFTFA